MASEASPYVFLSFKVSQEYHDWLCALSQKQGLEFTKMMEISLANYAREHKARKPPERLHRRPRMSRRSRVA